MLIFFGNFAGARQWWIGPLITLLPLLLNSGLLGAPLHLLSWLVRAAAAGAHAGRSAAGSCEGASPDHVHPPPSRPGVQFGFSGTFVFDPSTRAWRRQGPAAPVGGGSDGGSGGGSDGLEEEVPGAAVVSAALVGLTSMLVTAALTVMLLRFCVAVSGRVSERLQYASLPCRVG
jgi:hypothetical protein